MHEVKGEEDEPHYLVQFARYSSPSEVCREFKITEPSVLIEGIGGPVDFMTNGIYMVLVVRPNTL